MAKQIEGVYEKVYECAKKEFLTKGFKDASLRTIATAAGTSTGSIYTRFHNKEGLFHAIVAPVAEGLENWFLDMQETFHQLAPDEQKKIMFEYSSNGAEDLVKYIYDNYDEFKMLLECSEGTEFFDFLNKLVEIELDYTVKFMDCTNDDALNKKGNNREFLHIVMSSYYSGIFEIVRHDMRREDGLIYAKKLREFYYAGFSKIYDWDNKYYTKKTSL